MLPGPAGRRGSLRGRRRSVGRGRDGRCSSRRGGGSRRGGDRGRSRGGRNRSGSCRDDRRRLRHDGHRLRHVDQPPRGIAARQHTIGANHSGLVLVLGEPRREPHVRGDQEQQEEQAETEAEEREPVDPSAVGSYRRDGWDDVGLGEGRGPRAADHGHGSGRNDEGSTGRLHVAGFSQAGLGGGNRAVQRRSGPEEPEGGFEPPTYHLRGGCSTPELLRRGRQDTGRPEPASQRLWAGSVE